MPNKNNTSIVPQQRFVLEDIKMAWYLIILIVSLGYSISTKIENVGVNPDFTEISAPVLPLKYSQNVIVSKRFSPKYDQKMIVKRATNPFSNSQNEGSHPSPPHSAPRTIGNRKRAENEKVKFPSVVVLADDLKNLSITQHLSTSSSANGLPPRSPNRSRITSSTSDGKIHSNTPGRTSHKPSDLSKTAQSSETRNSQIGAQSMKGKHCTCTKIGGVCGC